MLNLKKNAVTSSVIILCLVVYSLKLCSSSLVFDYLLFDWDKMVSQGQIWRCFTPALIHFSFSHILMNILFFNYFSEHLEIFRGKYRLVCIILITGIISNFAQALFSGNCNFGGLSGVVSGIIGYCIMISPYPYCPEVFRSAISLCVVNIIFNIIAFYMDEPVAFWAHGIGLMAGIVLGIFDYFRLMRQSDLEPKFEDYMAVIKRNLQIHR